MFVNSTNNAVSHEKQTNKNCILKHLYKLSSVLDEATLHWQANKH